MGILNILFGKSSNAAYIKEMYLNGAIILDVRTPEEFKCGHIKNAINIPVQILDAATNSLKQQNRPVITVCQTGVRSSMAVGILKKAGIDAFNGGAWELLQTQLR
jgi:rhodanese-related sulfurtransferase